MKSKALVVGLAAGIASALPAHGVPMDAFRQCKGYHASPERAALACTAILTSRELKREDVPEFLDYRGDAYTKAGRFAEALVDFDSAIALDPQDADAYNGRCWARAVWNRDLFTALTDCDISLQFRPGDDNTLDSRALVHFRRGDYVAARADLEAALAKAPQRASLLYIRGLVKLKTGDASAQADIDAAKAADPKIAEIYVGYGVTP